MINKYNNEFESARKADRAGFGEFANTTNGIHLQGPSEHQIKIREEANVVNTKHIRSPDRGRSVADKIHARKKAELEAEEREVGDERGDENGLLEQFNKVDRGLKAEDENGLLEQFNKVDQELKMKPKLDIVDNLINLIPTHVEYYFHSKWIVVRLVKVERDTNTIDIMMPTTNHVRNTVFEKIRLISNSSEPLNKWRNIRSNMKKEELR